MDIQEILQKQFGLKNFQGPQEKVISGVLKGQSQLLIMPTGGGKSLCYQLPAVAKSGTALVISPLIALMKDQVDQLQKLGIRATAINSSLSRQERESRQKKLSAGEYDLCLITPERFRKTEFIDAISKINLSFLAVDEAHCISQWGHDFRPEYARVGEIRKQIGSPTVLALTATATPDVQIEICEILEIPAVKVFKTSVERPNLHVGVADLHGLEQKVDVIENIVRSVPGPKIIYASLIQSLHKIGAELEKRKIRYGLYHGQLHEKKRKSIQEDFLKSDGMLLLATPAFGLGVNKPNVRSVIHAEMPNSLEAYFQEIGRAGRDGKTSNCILLYDEDDVSIQMDFLKWSNPDGDFIKRVHELILRNPDRAKQEREDYLRSEMNFYNSRDFRVETSINLLRSWGVLEGWEPTEDLTDDMIDAKARAERLTNQQKKLLSMVQWVNAPGCRMQNIYEYFGELDQSPCGVCDLCQAD